MLVFEVAMCVWTQTFYSCGHSGDFVLKDDYCECFSSCTPVQGPDSHLRYPCWNCRRYGTAEMVIEQRAAAVVRGPKAATVVTGPRHGCNGDKVKRSNGGEGSSPGNTSRK
jgi:hypothetical protein